MVVGCANAGTNSVGEREGISPALDTVGISDVQSPDDTTSVSPYS